MKVSGLTELFCLQADPEIHKATDGCSVKCRFHRSLQAWSKRNSLHKWISQEWPRARIRRTSSRKPRGGASRRSQSPDFTGRKLTPSLKRHTSENIRLPLAYLSRRRRCPLQGRPPLDGVLSGQKQIVRPSRSRRARYRATLAEISMNVRR